MIISKRVKNGGEGGEGRGIGEKKKRGKRKKKGGDRGRATLRKIVLNGGMLQVAEWSSVAGPRGK